MASVQEILLALESQKSPFESLLEGVAGGVSTAQSKAFENAKTLIALEQQRADRERLMANDQMIRQALTGQAETSTQNQLKTVGTPATPPEAPHRLKMKATVGDEGYLKPSFEIVELKETKFGAKEYQDPTTSQNRIGKLNETTGELVTSPNDPLAVKQPMSEVDKLDARARAKLEKERPKARGSLTETMREYDNMIREAEDIKKDPALYAATGMTALSGAIPGTPMKRVAARLNTLKAKTLLNVLGSLKQLSATGASGFGQLSEIEGENIRNSVSTLDPNQRTEDFQAGIDRFITEMKARKETLRATFEDTYGEPVERRASVQSVNPPSSSSGTPKKVGRFELIEEK